MHHLRSGAQNLQPTGGFGGLMTLIMARNTFSRWGGARPGRVGSAKAGWEPAPLRPAPTGWGERLEWGVGKQRGRDPEGGRGQAGLEGGG